MKICASFAIVAAGLVVLPGHTFSQDIADPVSVADGIRPFVDVIAGRTSQFTLSGTIRMPIDDKPQSVTIRLVRFDDVSFDLALTHDDYAVEIRRRDDVTVLLLPRHSVAYVGRGLAGASRESLQPAGIMKQLVSLQSELAAPARLIATLPAEAVELSLGWVAEELNAVQDPKSGRWTLTDRSLLQFPAAGTAVYRKDDVEVSLTVTSDVSVPVSELPDVKTVDISRAELERTLVRGVHRATEILKPAMSLRKPSQVDRKTACGQLRWIDGHRVALLSGTPQQIGDAHGRLLKAETMRCIESVLYTFGTVHVIRTGRWFRHDLEEAYASLQPHIPERHKQETRALAAAVELPVETAAVLNVFPELFHCSGFAVFGSATADGKLYHGRVLDYMTTIGLQDAATTFIVKPDGLIPFANVGYAGFIGSVSGMNSKAVSLGEMGGRGEGRWDGVPMATLMRRALEECSDLDEVMTLWKDSPRTCEYYYVFADGKTNQAVGVAAVPESIEFIFPGESHERLGTGIKDAVVLSAGSRLEKLRERVMDRHGDIDADIGQWLMSRPVAMQSNLHNVLFVPADGLFYVANASHSKPAAEQPYVKLNLPELLKSFSPALPLTAASRHTDADTALQVTTPGVSAD